MQLIGLMFNLGRGGMGAKIEAAMNAVSPGSECNACVVAAGSDYDSIRAILGRQHNPKFGPPKGTLFATPDSILYKVAMEDAMTNQVSSVITILLFHLNENITNYEFILV